MTGGITSGRGVQSRPSGKLLAVALCSVGACLLGPGLAAADQLDDPATTGELWYDGLAFRLFADGYASVNPGWPRPQAGSNALRAFDRNNGFSLSWVGADVDYPPDPVGGTLNLRLGPTADGIARSCLSRTTGCDADVSGLGLLSQAFASWGPVRGVSLDFGKFNAPYGAEVAESQDNVNYTRGLVFWLGQPRFHTGLRMAFEPLPELKMTALVVNGWNNTLDNNLGKTCGFVLGYQPRPEFRVQLGWVGGPEQDDTTTLVCPADTEFTPDTGTCTAAPGAAAHEVLVDRGRVNRFEFWRHLGDLVVRYRPLEVLELMLNANYGEQGTRTLAAGGDTLIRRQRYYAAMLALRYALDETWSLAGRGEYFADPDGLVAGISQLELVSGTLTLESRPADRLIVRLEQRADFAVEAEGSTLILPKGTRSSSSQQYTTTLGVVVMTR